MTDFEKKLKHKFRLIIKLIANKYYKICFTNYLSYFQPLVFCLNSRL